ncbi:MAG: alginate export family protein, partial [Planctomycetota bacterium]
MQRPSAPRYRSGLFVVLGSMLMDGGLAFNKDRAWAADAATEETIRAAGTSSNEDRVWQVTVPEPPAAVPTVDDDVQGVSLSRWELSEPKPEQRPVDRAKKTKAAAAKAAKSHKPLFYDNDFSYVCDPCYVDWHIGDALKRGCLGSCIGYDIGGQFRLRHHSERNHRGVGLTGRDDDFLLCRTRLYANVEIGQVFRAYAEMIDAVSNYETFLPRPIEENRADLHNLFGDFLLGSEGRGELWARVGRQELLYGAERTVSRLDWVNTRRSFEGYKAFWKGEQWDIDAFWTRPIVPITDRFDSPDHDRQFMGIYSTYHGFENETVELFYLRLQNEVSPFDFHTLGARLKGNHGPWLHEFWGAVQFGGFRGQDHSAGAWTLGLGREFKNIRWKPTIWVYYDWASGSDTIGNGYHHLFPLAHKYLGFMDLFGRRNIETPNLQITMSPREKVKLLVWYYYLFLENQDDVPYSVVMTALDPGNAPASPDLGHEIDCAVSY